MIIINPQWQGIGKINTVPEGAETITTLLNGLAPEIIPCDNTDITLEEGVYGLTKINALTDQVAGLLDQKQPERIFTCGGDCSSDYAQLTYLNHKYDGDFTLIWIDAHADLNTPDSSPSGNFHGMTLRCLTGEGSSSMVQKIKKPISPSQIVFSGLRSIDPEETRYLDAHHIPVYSVEETRDGALKNANFPHQNVYLHVDIDSLDQSVIRDCATPTSGGYDLDTLTGTIRDIMKSHNIIGACLTEYGPKSKGASADIVEKLLFEGFGLKKGELF